MLSNGETNLFCFYCKHGEKMLPFLGEMPQASEYFPV